MTKVLTFIISASMATVGSVGGLVATSDNNVNDVEETTSLYSYDDESNDEYEGGEDMDYVGTSVSCYDTDGGYAYYTIDAYGNTSGYDSNGNYVYYHTDDFGNTTGYDSNGNYISYHTDDFGNTTGYDSNGNYVSYYTDDFGNTTGYDSNGNYISAYTDDFGNTTVYTY